MTTAETPVKKEDRLVAFAEWYLSLPFGEIGNLPPRHIPVLSQGKVAHVVLYREGEYQVEQYFILEPNAAFPPHTHPHVDTIEIDLTGEIQFTVDGKPTPTNLTLHIPTASSGTIERNAVRIEPNQEHWVRVGATGGAFISIQRWVGAKPTSVVLDWDGPTFSEIHRKNIQSRDTSH